MADFKISGRMNVQNLQKQFNENFGATLRVYKGNAFADPKATLASIRTSDNTSGDLTVSGNMHVGTFEREMKENFGIKVQVASSDGLSLIANDTPLAQCGKKVKRRALKEEVSDLDQNQMERKVISAEIEIYPVEHYGDSYGALSVPVELSSSHYDSMVNGNTDYSMLLDFILDILENNISVIIEYFNTSYMLEDLKSSSYDWFNMDPCIRVLGIGEVDLRPIYNPEVDGDKAAELLDKPVDEIEDYISDFNSEIRFGLSEELFRTCQNNS